MRQSQEQFTDAVIGDADCGDDASAGNNAAEWLPVR